MPKDYEDALKSVYEERKDTNSGAHFVTQLKKSEKLLQERRNKEKNKE